MPATIANTPIVVPPPWKDLEASPGYQQASPEKRRQAFQIWVNDVLNDMDRNEVRGDERRAVLDKISQKYKDFDNPSIGFGDVAKAVIVEPAKMLGATALAGTAPADAVLKAATGNEDFGGPTTAFQSNVTNLVQGAAEKFRGKAVGPGRLLMELAVKPIAGLFGVDTRSNEQEKLDNYFERLRQRIDDGDVTEDFLKGWGEGVKKAAADLHLENPAEYNAPERDVLSIGNLELLKAYKQTRDPRLLRSLKDNMAGSETRKQAAENVQQSTVGERGALPAFVQETIQASADPTLPALVAATALAPEITLPARVQTALLRAGLPGVVKAAPYAIKAMEGGAIIAGAGQSLGELSGEEKTPEQRRKEALLQFVTGSALGLGGKVAKALKDISDRNRVNRGLNEMALTPEQEAAAADVLAKLAERENAIQTNAQRLRANQERPFPPEAQIRPIPEVERQQAFDRARQMGIGGDEPTRAIQESQADAAARAELGIQDGVPMGQGVGGVFSPERLVSEIDAAVREYDALHARNNSILAEQTRIRRMAAKPRASQAFKDFIRQIEKLPEEDFTQAEKDQLIQVANEEGMNAGKEAFLELSQLKIDETALRAQVIDKALTPFDRLRQSAKGRVLLRERLKSQAANAPEGVDVWTLPPMEEAQPQAASKTVQQTDAVIQRAKEITGGGVEPTAATPSPTVPDITRMPIDEIPQAPTLANIPVAQKATIQAQRAIQDAAQPKLTFIGQQETPGGGKMDLFNLEEPYPGLEVGSTYSRQTLEKAGFVAPGVDTSNPSRITAASIARRYQELSDGKINYGTAIKNARALLEAIESGADKTGVLDKSNRVSRQIAEEVLGQKLPKTDKGLAEFLATRKEPPTPQGEPTNATIRQPSPESLPLRQAPADSETLAQGKRPTEEAAGIREPAQVAPASEPQAGKPVTDLDTLDTTDAARATVPRGASHVEVTLPSGKTKVVTTSQFKEDIGKDNIYQGADVSGLRAGKMVGGQFKPVAGAVGITPKGIGRPGFALNPVQLAIDLYKSIKDYATWAAEMEAQLGRDIIGKLKALWQHVRATPEQRVMMERNSLIANAKNMFMHGDRMPTPFHWIIESRDRQQQAWQQQASRLAHGLRKKVNAVKGTSEEKEARVGQVAAFLEGSVKPEALPEAYRSDAQALRAEIDKRSMEIAAQLDMSDNLRNVLGAKLGTYLSRVYAIFQDPVRWRENITPEMQERAIGWIEKNWNEKGVTREKAVEIYNEFIDREKLGDFLFGRNQLAGKDVTSLLRRQELPEELREVLGEIKDPFDRAYMTLDKQGQMLANDTAQKAIRNLGLRLGLFREGGAQLPKDVQFSPSADSGKRFDNYRGLFTDEFTRRQFQKLFERAQSDNPFKDMPGKILRDITSAFKMMNVALNPASFMPNMYGDYINNWLQGRGFTPRAYNRAARQLGIIGEDGRVDRAQYDKWRDYGVREGALGQNVMERDIQAGLGKGYLTDVPGYDKAQRAIGEFYGSFNNPPKWEGFIEEAAAYKRIYPKLTESELAAKAGEIFRQTSFNYDAVPSGVKLASDAGWLTGVNLFINFQYAMFRSAANAVKVGAQEARAGRETNNTALMQRGLARLVATATVLALSTERFGLSMWSKKATGMTDEKQDAYNRSFAEEWEKTDPKVWTKAPDGTKFSYAATQYLNPFTALVAGAEAALKGENVEDGAGKMVETYKDLFFSDSPLRKAYTELSVNRNEQGRNIYNPEGTAARRTAEIGTYLFKHGFTPGVLRDLNKMYKTPEEGGLTIGQEAQRFGGLRVKNVDVNNMLPFRIQGLQDRIQAARDIYGKIARSPKSTPLERSEARAESAEALQQIFQRFFNLRDDFYTLNGTEAQFITAMKDAKASDADLMGILSGKTPKLQPVEVRQPRKEEALAPLIKANAQENTEAAKRRELLSVLDRQLKSAPTPQARVALFKTAIADGTLGKTYDEVNAAAQTLLDAMGSTAPPTQQDKLLLTLSPSARAVQITDILKSTPQNQRANLFKHWVQEGVVTEAVAEQMLNAAPAGSPAR